MMLLALAVSFSDECKSSKLPIAATGEYLTVSPQRHLLSET